jgi:hypothetical protein
LHSSSESIARSRQVAHLTAACAAVKAGLWMMENVDPRDRAFSWKSFKRKAALAGGLVAFFDLQSVGSTLTIEAP